VPDCPTGCTAFARKVLEYFVDLGTANLDLPIVDSPLASTRSAIPELIHTIYT
jgi:hypothetical protein